MSVQLGEIYDVFFYEDRPGGKTRLVLVMEVAHGIAIGIANEPLPPTLRLEVGDFSVNMLKSLPKVRRSLQPLMITYRIPIEKWSEAVWSLCKKYEFFL